MAKETKQQRIESLEQELRNQTVRAEHWERDHDLSQRARSSFHSQLSDFLLRRDEIVDTGTMAVFREKEKLSEEGILRKIACLAERECIYRTEKEAIEAKYHELVRGIAKIPEKVSNNRSGRDDSALMDLR